MNSYFISLGIILTFLQCNAEWISYDQSYEDMSANLQYFQNLGWHLTSIDGYPLDGQVKYAAIWEQGNTPDTRKITIGGSWTDFQQEFDANVDSGIATNS